MTDVRQPAGTSAQPAAGAALLLSPVRRAILEELARAAAHEREEGLSAAELGRRLDLHATTIRFHVDQLVAARLLDSRFVRSGGVGRPSKKYVLHEVPLGGDAQDGEGPFALLAGLLTSVLSTQEAARLTPEEAGARWARERAAAMPPHVVDAAGPPGEDGAPQGQLGRVREVTRILAEWGYTPDVEAEEGGEVGITLRDCPFLPLAASHPDVVCGVHRGLLRGALDAVGETGARVSLRPFTGPKTCRAVLRLAPSPPDAPESSQTTSEPPIEGDHR